MRRFLQNSERLATKASLFAANLAAIILMLLVVLTCVDVIGRYFFTRPVVGAVELVRIAMAGIIFFSFPLMFLKNDHIIVDLITLFKRGYIGWLVSLIFLAIIIYVAVILGDRVGDYAVRAFEDGDTTEYLAIPRFVIVSFITGAIFSAGFMCALRFLILLFHPGEDVEDDLSPVLGDAE